MVVHLSGRSKIAETAARVGWQLIQGNGVLDPPVSHDEAKSRFPNRAATQRIAGPALDACLGTKLFMSGGRNNEHGIVLVIGPLTTSCFTYPGFALRGETPTEGVLEAVSAEGAHERAEGFIDAVQCVTDPGMLV